MKNFHLPHNETIQDLAIVAMGFAIVALIVMLT
jgi:hypothetical protein